MIFLLSLIIIGTDACKVWECSKLEPDLCAIWNEKVVKINTDPCTNSKKCYILGLEFLMTSNTNGKYYCEDFEFNPLTLPVNCNSKKLSNTYNKPHPLQCFKNSDCISNQGKQKNCVCAMDGKAYCELLEGDEELKLYNKKCYDINSEEAFAWYLYIDYFPILHHVPRCAQTLFEEIQILIKFHKLLNISYAEAFL